MVVIGPDFFFTVTLPRGFESGSDAKLREIWSNVLIVVSSPPCQEGDNKIPILYNDNPGLCKAASLRVIRALNEDLEVLNAAARELVARIAENLTELPQA